MIIDVFPYEVEIFDDHSWTVQVGSIHVADGETSSASTARNNALAAINKHLDKTRAKVTEKLEDAYVCDLPVFQWRKGDTRIKLSEQGTYGGVRMRDGDWVFPTTDVVLNNAVFQKLFRKAN